MPSPEEIKQLFAYATLQPQHISIERSLVDGEPFFKDISMAVCLLFSSASINSENVWQYNQKPHGTVSLEETSADVAPPGVWRYDSRKETARRKTA